MRLKSDSFVVESNVRFPTDYNLLWDCACKCIGTVSRLMNKHRDIVIELADRFLPKYKVASWSFDKGFWLKENKQILQLEVPQVIIPKLGKRNKTEDAEEHSTTFKHLKNKHSAIESNINELEHRGLDICPDRSYLHFKRYIGLAVCAYNLKKIGRQILKLESEALTAVETKIKSAA